MRVHDISLVITALLSFSVAHENGGRHCANGRKLQNTQCDCTADNSYFYVIDPQPKQWLDTKKSVSVEGQCQGSDIAEDTQLKRDPRPTGAFRNFSRRVSMGRTFYHPNYYSSNYSSLCNATSCTNSTDGIGGVSYELSDLQENFPSGTMYLGLQEGLKFNIDLNLKKCWGDSPWYSQQPGFAIGDAVDVLCAGAKSVSHNDVKLRCSSSASAMLRLVDYDFSCIHNTSWFILTLLNSLTVINRDNPNYNNPREGIYNWASVQSFFTIQDFSSEVDASRLLSIEMPTLGLLSTCPFGGDTFRQVYARGFRANVHTQLGRVDVVVNADGSPLPKNACVCPEKPVWVRMVNNIFANDVKQVLIFYRFGSILTMVCAVIILVIYLRAPYLQKQPYSSMVRMAVCDGLFSVAVLIWTYTTRNFRSTANVLGAPSYSADNFHATDVDPYGSIGIPTDQCKYFSPWTQLFMMGSMLYYTSVSVHLHHNIRNPFYAATTSSYDAIVCTLSIFSVFVLWMFATANSSVLQGYSQFLFCWYSRDITTDSSSMRDLNWPMWITFYAPLVMCLSYTLYVSQSARKSLNDGLHFSSQARTHVLSTNRRFVLVNVALWLMVGVPTVMVWLSPSTCLPSSTLSVYGIVLGLRGVCNIALWGLCIPGLFDMMRIQYLIRMVHVRKFCYRAYKLLCPCIAQPHNAPSMPGGLEPLLNVETELTRSLSMSLSTDSGRGSASSDSSEDRLSAEVIVTSPADPMHELRARHKEIVAQNSEADYFLRAEVVWLVSWGTLFNMVKHYQPQGVSEWDDDDLLWPENHSVQEMNSLKEILSNGTSLAGSTWRFRSFNPRHRDSYKLTVLRQIFSESAAAASSAPTSTPSKFSSQELYDLDEQVPCDSRRLSRTHVQHLPQWELGYVYSMCPETQKISIIAKEKFNIGGKSGAPFYFTHDSVYIIKMITETESTDFTKFFESYFTYMTLKGPKGERKNMDSLLLRVFGCHSVRTRATQGPQHFLVMANVLNFPTHLSISGIRASNGQCERRYDLKGSSAGRVELSPEKLQSICEKEIFDGMCRTDLPTLLDNDYRLEQSLGLGIKIEPEAKKRLMRQMLKDCIFLASENVMDYSMLVGRWRRTVIGVEAPEESAEGVMHSLHVLPHAEEENVWFYFGFIDVTQHYNFSKRAERLLKRVLYCRNTATMSACPPVQYARRFLLEMNTYIEPPLVNFESEVDLMFEHCGLFWVRYDQ